MAKSERGGKGAFIITKYFNPSLSVFATDGQNEWRHYTDVELAFPRPASGVP